MIGWIGETPPPRPRLIRKTFVNIRKIYEYTFVNIRKFYETFMNVYEYDNDRILAVQRKRPDDILIYINFNKNPRNLKK